MRDTLLVGFGGVCFFLVALALANRASATLEAVVTLPQVLTFDCERVVRNVY